MPICQNPKKKTVSPEVIGVAPPAVSKKLMKRSSRFIRNVYETDPLSSLTCHGEMQIISFIDQPEVIKKILGHLALWKEFQPPTDITRQKRSHLRPFLGSAR